MTCMGSKVRNFSNFLPKRTAGCIQQLSEEYRE
jgi:hypothetical protein